jgi:hypothetical protein
MTDKSAVDQHPLGVGGSKALNPKEFWLFLGPARWPLSIEHHRCEPKLSYYHTLLEWLWLFRKPLRLSHLRLTADGGQHLDTKRPSGVVGLAASVERATIAERTKCLIGSIRSLPKSFLVLVIASSCGSVNNHRLTEDGGRVLRLINSQDAETGPRGQEKAVVSVFANMERHEARNFLQNAGFTCDRISCHYIVNHRDTSADILFGIGLPHDRSSVLGARYAFRTTYQITFVHDLIENDSDLEVEVTQEII